MKSMTSSLDNMDAQEITENNPIDEMDRLRAENLQLRALNLISRKRELLRSIEEVDNSLRKVQEETTGFKSVLASKYNIDFTKQQIEPSTGRVIPAP